jgi:TolA-binding protein
MTEPKRWIDEGPPAEIAHLVRAAATEQPSERSMSRTLTTLGVAVGTATAASTAGASGTVAAASAGKAVGLLATSAVVKWGALATAVTAAGFVGSVVIKHAGAARDQAVASAASHRAAPPAATQLVTPQKTVVVRPTGVEAVSPSASAETVTPSENVAPTAPQAAVEARSADGPVAAPVAAKRPLKALSTAVEATPTDVEHLAEEVALVDRAREALARGDAAAALKALDEYDSRFSRRKFAPEALYLRMESLLRMGRSGGARSVAQSLVNAYPTSPHAARARQVLAQAIP